MSEESTTRFLNVAAMHSHLLECSAKIRAGKFTRVSPEILAEVEADVESWIRDLNALKWPVRVHEPVDPGNLRFTTGALMEKVEAALNNAIGRLLQGKVFQQPSVGVTIKGTR
jgi:hypothetical protein